MALPPMVNAEIIAETIPVNNKIFILVISFNIDTITTPVEPDTIPQTSPMTSQQIEDTLELFFIRKTPIFPPFIFLALMELNTVISPQVTETPMISKIIPININISVVIMVIVKDTLLSTNVDIIDIINDNISDNNVTIIIHFDFFILFSI